MTQYVVQALQSSTAFRGKSRRNAVVFIVAAWSVYAAVFIVLYAWSGNAGLAALSLLPVVAIGWFCGLRAGFLAGLLSLPLNTLLLNAVGQAPAGWDVVFRVGGGPGSAVIVLLGFIVGQLHDATIQWQRELSEREKAERSLQDIEQHVRALLTTAQRQAQEASLLDQVRAVLARETDLDLILRTVVEAIAATFGYTQVSLYLHHGDSLLLQHQVGYTHVIDRIPLTQGISGRVMRTGQPVWLADVHGDPDFLGAIEGIESEICVPLFEEGRAVGVLNLESSHGVRLTEDDLRIAQALAQDIGIALGRARLYSTLQRRAEERALLYESVRDLATYTDPPTLLQTIVERALRLSKTGGGAIYVSDNAQRQLKRAYQSGDLPMPEQMPWGEGIPGRVAQSGELLLVDDFAHHSDAEPAGGWASVMGVPLYYVNELIAVLIVAESDPERKFTTSDTLLISLFANQAASVIHEAELFRQVQELSRIDELTGLCNRRYLFELGERELRRARRFGHSLSAIMLDIDRFKQINDKYGHLLGDQVLHVVAERCVRQTRGIDVVARYGGEEFVVLLAETELQGAKHLAERLRQCVSDSPIPTEQGPIALTVSMGLTVAQPETDTLDAMLARADRALYAAKNAGRNRVVVGD